MTLFAEPLPDGPLGIVRLLSFAAVVAGAVALAPRRAANGRSAPAGSGKASTPSAAPRAAARSCRTGIEVGEELGAEADDEDTVIVSRPGGETIGDRRPRALDRAAGAPPGVRPAAARDEWH
jgi:hypothetical protein